MLTKYAVIKVLFSHAGHFTVTSIRISTCSLIYTRVSCCHIPARRADVFHLHNDYVFYSLYKHVLGDQ